MPHSRSRRSYRRRNPQAPVWQKPLWTNDSAVWRGPLFRNPDEHDDIPAPSNRYRNPQAPVWGSPLWTNDSAAWRGPLFRNNPEELDVVEEEVLPAAARHYRRRRGNPQAPVWGKPLWTNDSPAWRGNLFRNNPDAELEIDEEVVTPSYRRRNPQLWAQDPLWTSNSAVWRGPLFRNNPEDSSDCEICNRRNPQAPVWGSPLWTNDSAAWRGPLFRNPDEGLDHDVAPASRRLRRFRRNG